MAKKTVGTAEVGSSRCDDRTAQRAVPTKTVKPSALLDTRVIYCGDNLEQLAKLPDVKRMQKDEGRMMKPPRSVILHSTLHNDRQLLLPLRLARQPLRQSHARPDF
jgi:hypothetical protein